MVAGNAMEAEMTPGLRPTDYARAAAFTLLPAVAVAGAMGLPVLIGLAGLAALSPAMFRQVIEKPRLWALLLLAFVAWAAVSGFWSAWEGPSGPKVLLVMAVGLPFAIGAAANERTATLTLAGAVAAFAMLAVFLGVEAAFDMPLNRAAEPDLPWGELNRNPSRGLIVLLALVWPAVAWLLASGRAALRLAALAVIVVCAVLSLQFGQQSTAVGFGLGLIVFAVAFAAPQLSILALSLSLAAWLLIAPFATPLLVANPQLVEAVPMSWAHRIAIWRYTCAQIMEQPWIGHGIDAGRATTEMISIRGMEMRGIPVHPHSASLQIWHDLGLVGALLAAALLAYGGWRLSRTFAHDKLGGAATAAVLCMFGLMANIGWSVWQEWWIATLLLAAALIAALSVRAARA
jgi:O-antigen ligase